MTPLYLPCISTEAFSLRYEPQNLCSRSYPGPPIRFSVRLLSFSSLAFSSFHLAHYTHSSSLASFLPILTISSTCPIKPYLTIFSRCHRRVQEGFSEEQGQPGCRCVVLVPRRPPHSQHNLVISLPILTCTGILVLSDTTSALFLCPSTHTGAYVSSPSAVGIAHPETDWTDA
jgi:hypothetical protein